MYRIADKSLARPTSRCILFDGENISFDVSLVIFINSTNIPPVMIINRIFIHSFSILSDDRSKASSKTMPPHSAMQSLLLQMRVSSPVLKVI